ncbi:glucan synthase [Mycotypha africana]|uniref:glucan synthase n=1 Tax=Mycotypha africana TaxID=64632 RepID=UPI00230154C5|nr:glucan synthase [Mycotypha africana]KAI8990937.1 glucan synthase [Mycotypha africana]
MQLIRSKQKRNRRGITATSASSIFSRGFQSPNLNSIYDLSEETLVNESSVPYPSWMATKHSKNLPSYEQINNIFMDLKDAFGFQYDSMLNMLDYLMTMLDSRASRMSPAMALLTLHADYIGGPNANYRKWYFASQLSLDDVIGDKNSANNMKYEPDNNAQQQSLNRAEEVWRRKMERMTDVERIRQLALWLLIWGEASVIRFCPEALCYIFKLADEASLRKIGLLQNQNLKSPEGEFIEKVIRPLYDFVKDQVYHKEKNSNLVRRDRDHSNVIGYDDVNQYFWYSESIVRLRTHDKTKLVNISPQFRYDSLQHVNWQEAFQKTFKEKRSWMHLAVNFTRIWIIHIVSFWYYVSFNSDVLYLNSDKSIAEKEMPVKISVAALGGALATILVMIGCFVEYIYVPMTFQRAGILSGRLVLLFFILILNAGPSIYCLRFKRTGSLSMAIALTQLFVSLITSISFAIIPQSRLFIRKGSASASNSKNTPASQTFTASFPYLKRRDRITSIGLWVCVFGCKFLESYFFIALSFKDPLKAITKLDISHCNEPLTGSILCARMPIISIALMFLMELILFFLDTYLWYVIWNTVFSVARSFYLGISLWSPWRNTFSRLPKRIYAKLLATSELDLQLQPKALCSQVWNALIISMFREHLLSADHVSKLLYKQILSTGANNSTLKTPTFFVSQEDVAFKTEYYPQKSEASRRIQFFAQSLTTPMPEALPVPNMPTFTVMTPHYGEKILLSLREIIREEDKNTRITLLEYLKQLHPFEWENFVKDSKILAGEETLTKDEDGDLMPVLDEKKEEQDRLDDLPFYCVGFKTSTPEYTLRTRIWASLRSQTLFRTITGFMNYQKAVKLLYRVETPELSYLDQHNNIDSPTAPSEAYTAAETELEKMANRKFRFVVAMQRYASFTAEEKENVDYILKAYPDLQIAYIEEENVPRARNQTDNIFNIIREYDTIYYTVLIDGRCALRPDGTRTPKYRIRLPGNPILGDGKSDNQNTALPFCRGEYLQLIDANQDNYLEECIKIRNLLGEFEEMQITEESPYASNKFSKSPVAIVGAREYIFSENIGVLGDVAAGKEQTFGTVTQRIMATIGGRFHYGHPDFLNSVFMTTRGGVSKAQKGLHLNEDIYAGINAFERGGRIKHVEYFQCGKGRDLGFGSVLNFATKIGSGMGEQLLSREYYYLGTQLPLDRFLTFFYAHPGFQINNIFIMLSIHVFMFVLLFLSVTNLPMKICDTNPALGADADLLLEGCYNMAPIFEWIKRVVISIFAVVFISFLPLFLHELTERGFFQAASRLCKQLLSLSPLFEIFVTQTYANSILNNLTFGGAHYIGTGRGFATARLPFSLLYSRFADTGMYAGARMALILLFGSMVLRIPHLAYFWFTILALVLSPYLFNPHQFSIMDFLVDYREYIRWLSRGHSTTHHNSWIEYCRFIRMRTTGTKKRQTGLQMPLQPKARARFSVALFSEILMPLLIAFLSISAYLFVQSFDEQDASQLNNNSNNSKIHSVLVRVGVIAMGPLLLNAVALGLLFFFSLVGGYLASFCCGVKFGATVAAIAHGWAVVNYVVFFEVLFFLENWNFGQVILGMIAVSAMQRLIFRAITVLLLTREFQDGRSNHGWWTGRWYGRSLGWHALTQPFREFVCKVTEMSHFATDFLLGHIILFVLFLICLIPCIDKWHSLMLFWLKPSKQIQHPIYTSNQRSRRWRIAVSYGLLLASLFVLFLALLIVPAILGPRLHLKIPLPI